MLKGLSHITQDSSKDQLDQQLKFQQLFKLLAHLFTLNKIHLCKVRVFQPIRFNKIEI